MGKNAESLAPAQGLLSHQLLDHAHLMTPVLQHFFGDIYAQQHQVEETADIYLRTSTLHQQLTPHHLLLEATLRIVKAPLPLALLHDLRTSTTPFGALLRRYRLNIELRNRRITSSGKPPVRLGRTLAIYQSETNALICHVQEMLVPEATLLLARDLYDQSRTQAWCEPLRT